VKVQPGVARVSWDGLLKNAAGQDPVGMALAALAAGILIESIPQLSALVRRIGGQHNTLH
jgi:hypothetical protein